MDTLQKKASMATTATADSNQAEASAQAREDLTQYALKVAEETREAEIRRQSRPTIPSIVFNMPRQAFWQFVYLVIINLFGLFVRLRFIYRAILYRVQSLLKHHHYTPAIIKRDVEGFKKIPNHLTVILPSPPLPKRRRSPTKSGSRVRADSTAVALEQLLSDVGELTAWCASAGITTLSVYEKTGILKSSIPGTYEAIMQKLKKYFPPSSIPHLNLRVPNVPSYSPPSFSSGNGPSPGSEALDQFPMGPSRNINVLLISAEDGRDTIVDLTKTLTAMVQKGKLIPQDISTELIDSEMRESIMDEPDLLICFTEEYHLDGYPPWHVRLTELFHLPDHTSGVTYNAFLQGLQMYNGSAMRFGK